VLGATTAIAADTVNPLSGKTCGEFLKMDSTAQANLVNEAGKVDSSLTSNSGTNSSNTSTDNAAASVTKPGVPLTAGQLVAACQAATPSSTVSDAYSASTGNGAI